jgi:hypothetical protein
MGAGDPPEHPRQALLIDAQGTAPLRSFGRAEVWIQAARKKWVDQAEAAQVFVPALA